MNENNACAPVAAPLPLESPSRLMPRCIPTYENTHHVARTSCTTQSEIVSACRFIRARALRTVPLVNCFNTRNTGTPRPAAMIPSQPFPRGPLPAFTRVAVPPKARPPPQQQQLPPRPLPPPLGWASISVSRATATIPASTSSVARLSALVRRKPLARRMHPSWSSEYVVTRVATTGWKSGSIIAGAG